MVDLLEDNDTGKKFALKRIQCHSREEERLAKEEAGYHRRVNHPNLIPLEEWKVTSGSGGVTEVLLVLPFFRVSLFWFTFVQFYKRKNFANCRISSQTCKKKCL